MGTQVSLIYTIQALGIASAKIQPFIASTPIPPEVLSALGLRVLSDSTTAGNVNPVVRTIVLGFNPSANAQATPVITNTSNIESVTVDAINDGLDYILPPIVRANNNAREPLSEIVQGNVIDKRPTQRDAMLKAYLNVKAAAQVAGGGGYIAPVTVTFLGGLPPANFNFDVRKGFRGGCVRYINIADPGEGYDPLTVQLNIQGGGPDGNTPPTPAEGVLVLDARGRVQSITIVDMGQDYVAVPDVFLTTTTGIPARRQAKLFAVMAEGTPARGTATIGAGPGFAISAINITQRGDNYVTVPDILIRAPNGGTGAIFRAQMAVGRIDVIAQGVGYFPGTTIDITPAFQEMFPVDPLDTQAQAAAFFQFLQGAIQQTAITPLTSATPLVA